MARAQLESGAISAFCESIAVMLSAGIQVDEAVAMLGEGAEETPFKGICNMMYPKVSAGQALSDAMEETGAFDDYATKVVRTGEQSGRLENVLRSLSVYYDEESRLIAKARSNITYPAMLMLIMTAVLAFTVANILPVFMDAYESLSGTLTGGSLSAINASLAIGWIAFIIMFVCAAFSLSCAVALRMPKGRQWLGRITEKTPVSNKATYKLALSRFTSALSTCVSAGTTAEAALERSMESAKNPLLEKKLANAYSDMVDAENPLGLAQAFEKNEVFDALSMRMLSVSARSGSLESTLEKLSTTFFHDAITEIEAIIDEIEPALAAFLTIAVGATLISVMIPLIGIMGSIG